MDFSKDRLPPSAKEIEWQWRYCVKEKIDLSTIAVGEQIVDFNLPFDYFDLSDDFADKISLIGTKHSFFSQLVSLKNVGLSILGNISADSEIGWLLENIKLLRSGVDVYGLFAKYKYIGKSVYCAITVYFIDKDTGEKMDTAVFEIGEDEQAYVRPVAISEETLDYYSFDDLIKIAYWLGDFWIGVQYELNNCPEEIRIIEQHGSITPRLEKKIKNEKQLVLVKRVIPIDEEGKEIKYRVTNSGRQYTVPVWGVRGHFRRLKSGKVTYVGPYKKGKERNNNKKGIQICWRKNRVWYTWKINVST